MHSLDSRPRSEPPTRVDTQKVADTFPRQAARQIAASGKCHQTETSGHSVFPDVVPGPKRERAGIRSQYVRITSSRVSQPNRFAGPERW